MVTSEMDADCVGPDESGVFLTMLCYDLLDICQSKFRRFEFLLYLVKRNQTANMDLKTIRSRWKTFLEISPLVDLIYNDENQYSSIQTLLCLLQMLDDKYVLMDTAITLATKVLEPEFEESLFCQFLEMINSFPIKLKDWTDKLLEEHSKRSKNKHFIKEYVLNKEDQKEVEKLLKLGCLSKMAFKIWH